MLMCGACGRMVREVCVYIKDDGVPLTDKVIAFKTIIEADEPSFLKMGNVYQMAPDRTMIPPNTRLAA